MARKSAADWDDLSSFSPSIIAEVKTLVCELPRHHNLSLSRLRLNEIHREDIAQTDVDKTIILSCRVRIHLPIFYYLYWAVVSWHLYGTNCWAAISALEAANELSRVRCF